MSRQGVDYCLQGQLHTFGTLDNDASSGSEPDLESLSHTLNPDETLIFKDIIMYRQRSNLLQSQTICFQKQTLGEFDTLETKIRGLIKQKQSLKEQFQLLSRQLQEPSFIQRQTVIKAQGKKTKNLPQSLMRMHSKVTGVESSTQDAICWLQRSLEEYCLIKKHSLEWRKAFEFIYGSEV